MKPIKVDVQIHLRGQNGEHKQITKTRGVSLRGQLRSTATNREQENAMSEVDKPQ